MKLQSSATKFLIAAVLVSTSAPAFAWRLWLGPGPRPGPRVVVPVPVPHRPVVVAPGPGAPVARAVEVQRALARHGYYHGSIDGIIGPASRSAIRSFQDANGLAVTGEINGPLLRALGL